MNYFLYLLAVLLLLCESTAIKADNSVVDSNVIPQLVCQEGFVQLGDQCYLFESISLTWQDALSICNNMEADLVHPINGVENFEIALHIAQNYPNYYLWWIGANDQAVEGEWRWSHDNSMVNYTNWECGQPDDYSNADCAVYRPTFNWRWDDGLCTSAYPFICQQRS